MAGGDIEAEIGLSLETAHGGGRQTLRLGGPDGSVTIDVTIPAGSREGTIIRLAGQGLYARLAAASHFNARAGAKGGQG